MEKSIEELLKTLRGSCSDANVICRAYDIFTLIELNILNEFVHQNIKRSRAKDSSLWSSQIEVLVITKGAFERYLRSSVAQVSLVSC